MTTGPDGPRHRRPGRPRDRWDDEIDSPGLVTWIVVALIIVLSLVVGITLAALLTH